VKVFVALDKLFKVRISFIELTPNTYLLFDKLFHFFLKRGVPVLLEVCEFLPRVES